MSVALFALVVSEGVLRLIGGYHLFGFRLEAVHAPVADPVTLLDMASEVVGPFAEDWRQKRSDLDIAWLQTSPPPLPRPPALDLPLLPQRDWLLHYYVLNEVTVRSPVGLALLRTPGLIVPDQLSVFTPPGGIPAPHYRYPTSSTLPTGLVTNSFGFRGRELTIGKPPRTVRIAFVGASTTVEAHYVPHSAPELIEHWLGQWADKQGLDVRFEVINAAREAIQSHDIRAIVAYEVMPLAIDYLVYYEGANQFQPVTLQKHVAVDGAYELAVPPAGIVGDYDGVEDVDTTWLDRSASYSAMARYLRSAMAGSERLAEPEKPSQRITLAPELRSGEFPIDRVGEVLECAAIARDLDEIRSVVEDDGARLVLSTFWWLADDGMMLDPVWAKNVHVHLNRSYWPFSYAVIRELADIQNRFFVAWAKDRGVDLIDVGAELPRHEQLGIDAIHHNAVGIRLKAWVMFAGLTRILARDLEAGKIPRAGPLTGSEHPHIGPVQTIPREQLIGR